MLLRVVLATGQPGDDQPGLAVRAEEILGDGRRRRPRRGQVEHVAGFLELALQIACDGAHLRALHALLAGEHEDQGLIADAELVRENPCHMSRLGIGVLLPARGEMLGDRYAEDGGRYGDK